MENLLGVVQRVKENLDRLMVDTELMTQKLAKARLELFGGPVGSHPDGVIRINEREWMDFAAANRDANIPPPPQSSVDAVNKAVSDTADRLAKVAASLGRKR